MSLPIVAVIGRPNVGKSTLFNRLLGRRKALVEDVPGVTRDRNYVEADVDGRPYTLVDTGGFDTESEEGLLPLIRSQCAAAIDEATLVLFVVDGRFPPTPVDLDIMDLLRRSGRRFLVVVNKIDGERQEIGAVEHYRLGEDRIHFVSAVHGRGLGDLTDAMAALLAVPEEPGADDEVAEPAVQVAVVGRPNSGKSSLVNRLLGEERMLVDAVAGTTRDPIDSPFEHQGRRYVLIDTAGIRRQSRVDRGPEKLAVMAAERAISRCDVAVLLIDALIGPAEQDAKILGFAIDHGRACIVALNKWDLLAGRAEAAGEIRDKTRDVLSFAVYVPVMHVSALTGRGVEKLVREVDRVYGEHGRRVPTARLNRLFEAIEAQHPPPLRKGTHRPNRLLYATQAGVHPPTFMVSMADPEELHFSYQRYVANRLREEFGFEGTPLRVHYRKRRRKK